MNRLPRHEQILKLVRANGFMPIEELARLLDVTPQTIRRDINMLAEEVEKQLDVLDAQIADWAEGYGDGREVG